MAKKTKKVTKKKEVLMTTVSTKAKVSTPTETEETKNLEVPEEEKVEEVKDLEEENEEDKYVYYVKLSQRELRNHRIRNAVIDLLGLRMDIQKRTPYHKISSAEFEIIKNTSLFTDKKKYKGTTYKGEVGKYKGRKLIVE